MRVAILTVSTSAAAGMRIDESGPLLASLASDAGFELVDTAVATDDAAEIEQRLRAYVADAIDVVLTTGGTGLTPDDVTPEATRAVIERELPGVAQALIAASLQHTPMGMLSRAVCGVAGSTIVINLPGSPRAVEQLFGVVAPVLEHAVAAVAGDARHNG
jgi:molybdopterin adenylyltransferase